MKVKKRLSLLCVIASVISLVACQVPVNAPPGAPDKELKALTAGTLDRETYVSLSVRALERAIDSHDAPVLDAFARYGEGAGDDPSATREIARRVRTGTVTSDLADTRVARVLRLADAAVTSSSARADGIRFPVDAGIHPFSLTEWWYVNGHLEGGPEARFGYEFTMFKVGPLLHWVHVALTDESGQRFDYIRDWVPVRNVTARPGRLDVRYGANHLWQEGETIRLQGAIRDGQYLDLTLVPRKQPLLINGDGLIDMPEGAYSWYYSQTRLQATGQVTTRGRTVPVQGLSWLDHQWGPFFVSGRGAIWDWFSLQFDDSTEYNVFGFRSQKGQPVARYLNESRGDGRGILSRDYRMARLGWWQSPRTGLHYTTRWRLDRPGTGEAFEIEAVRDDQELARMVPFMQDPLPTYWEGRMRAVKVTRDGRRIPGVAYCEHFGFERPQGPG